MSDELFKQAAEDAINKKAIEVNVVEVVKEIIEETEEVKVIDMQDAEMITAININSFEQLKVDLTGKHAARFNRVLSKLPDRDFVAAYLKSLEFTKPKVTRERQKSNVADNNTMTINIVRSGDNKEPKTIDITEISNNE